MSKRTALLAGRPVPAVKVEREGGDGVGLQPARDAGRRALLWRRPRDRLSVANCRLSDCPTARRALRQGACCCCPGSSRSLTSATHVAFSGCDQSRESGPLRHAGCF
jgi:hypothetical protein